MQPCSSPSREHGLQGFRTDGRIVDARHATVQRARRNNWLQYASEIWPNGRAAIYGHANGTPGHHLSSRSGVVGNLELARSPDRTLSVDSRPRHERLACPWRTSLQQLQRWKNSRLSVKKPEHANPHSQRRKAPPKAKGAPGQRRAVPPCTDAWWYMSGTYPRPGCLTRCPSIAPLIPFQREIKLMAWVAQTTAPVQQSRSPAAEQARQPRGTRGAVQKTVRQGKGDSIRGKGRERARALFG